jgi:hypothetical protein
VAASCRRRPAALSFFGTRLATATPRRKKVTTPRPIAPSAYPNARHTTATWKNATPISVMTVNAASAVTTADPNRPARYVIAGSGAPRSRFRIPCSRASTSPVIVLT